jgi:hypothetical protein
VVVVAGGAVGGGAEVGLLQATIVRLATMARRAGNALRIVQGVSPIAVKVSRRVDAMRGCLSTAGMPDRGRPSSGRTAPGWFRGARDSRGLRLVAIGVMSRQDGSAPDIVTGGAFCEKMLPVTSAVTELRGAPSFLLEEVTCGIRSIRR